MPWDPPERFPQSIDTLRDRLATEDDRLADELLADAERLFDEIDGRITSAETRASTLQGTVAIAATFALAGAGLVLQPGEVNGRGWRAAFAVGVGLLVLLLVLTAWRATSASARVFEFTTTSDDDIFDRARLPTAAQAKTRRAAHLVYGYGRNNEVAALKVGALAAAAFWFRRALLMLVILVAMFGVYATRSDSQRLSASPSPEVRRQPSRRAPQARQRRPRLRYSHH